MQSSFWASTLFVLWEMLSQIVGGKLKATLAEFLLNNNLQAVLKGALLSLMYRFCYAWLLRNYDWMGVRLQALSGEYF